MQQFLSYGFIFISLIISTQNMSIFKFSTESSIKNWQIINDDVMGGLSQSSLNLTEDGNGLFSGHVSLANNGGFASLRLPTNIKVNPETQYIVLKIKGDGKNYQFRLKGEKNQRQSYVQKFETNGKWQYIKLKVSDFSAEFRGRKLDMPDFNFSKIEEIRFLIANKKEEDFMLYIDSINLK